jgi:hypothetical protein
VEIAECLDEFVELARATLRFAGFFASAADRPL